MTEAAMTKAVDIVRRMLRELKALEAHTHGFAYPECPRCAREAEIKRLLKL
jgi:hypothetical protein